MAFTLLSERRKPSGERQVNVAKPDGLRRSANCWLIVFVKGFDHKSGTHDR